MNFMSVYDYIYNLTRLLNNYNKKIIIQYEINPERIVAIIFFEKYPTAIATYIAIIFGSL